MGKDLKGRPLPDGIVQRSNGSYRGRFQYKGEIYTKDNIDLKKLIQEMEDLRYEVKHGLKGKGDNVTLDEWFDVWLNTHKKRSIKESTQVRYDDFYRRYIHKQIGRHRIADFTPILIERLLQGMADKDYSTKTIHDVYNILNAMLKYAVHNRMIAYNPCTGVEVPKTKKKDIRVLTIEEQREVVEHAKGRLHESLIQVALGTGLRSGELRGLTWEDIDFQKREISISKTLVYIKDLEAKRYVFKYQTRDNVEMGENTVQEAMLDLQSGNIHYYISYLKDIVDEECDLSVRAGVLMERLKAYEPELPKDMQPMVYVNYCEESNLMNPRCQKLSELDTKTVEQDKAWYADRDPNTNEPKTTAQMFFTVYYAEKGDKMLHHFQGRIDIGTGNGGIISQLKMQNEMKLADESWISYQQGKGNEEYQKYMEDLTDMQNHVLPYLQSFCSQEEKGVKERREQQVAEKNESREAVPRTGVEANTAVKDAGKAERKAITEKKTMTGKEKKPSIHERLEINKRIIQEKQGKDKPERGADLSVRTV